MGEAGGTASVGNSGLGIFNAHQNMDFKPFIDDINEDYAEEHNIKYY